MRTGCTGDEIDLCDLEEFPEDEFPSPVSIDERGGVPLPGQVLDGLGDVGSLHGDGVLDSGLQEVQNIGPALDDDNGLGIPDVGSAGTCPFRRW